MTAFANFVLVSLCLAALIQQAESVCCGAKFKYLGGNICADCTKSTPYCSYGKCNIFGCACASSCREDCGSEITDVKKSGWFATLKYTVTCHCKNGKRAANDVVFDDMDANDDGKIDHQEFNPDLQ
ncbi:uncharacterized protein LOC106165317 isoform X2 [Lingula anatina]|uniref:Uncharacterized protein LOC106165317 isoform X2 n=1 Tax=Lingula anatina TaxID=7574 RepID=A0A1S3ILH5_LINAN|nr:uncharacterized protein LOC106165317 isoform X2 [Lingula anatina]XP_013398940.1 uncharacterized protein LOC106165317 isoform X2 [Lingula anatina]|eukprot:XP_013398938.1 uncharacterized protein LOC106165317 isoform X2 [Lingula anatina]